MFDILPALLWIVAAVISLNICSITAIRGNIFSKTKSDVYPVRWSIVGLHFTSLIIGSSAVSDIYDVQTQLFLEISAFLRTGWLAVGSTDGYAHRHGTGVYVSAGPKRHEKRNGKKTQPSH